MAAKTKPELLEVTQREYDKLCKLIAELDTNTALAKDQEDTSIKDVVAHRAHWIDLFLGWYRDGQAGKAVHFPARGYKWNQLKAYNAALRASQVDLGWSDARAALTEAHVRLVKLLKSLDDEALFSAPMKGARNDWTTGRWAEAAGPSHYRSAAKYIRARAREGAA